MSPLIEAELMRLRTVRTPIFVLLAALALVASNAGLLGGGHPANHQDVITLLEVLLVSGVLSAAAGAYSVGDGFQRGAVAISYVAHPRRERVAAAQVVTYAAAGVVFAVLSAAVGLAIVLRIAAADHVETGLSAADVAATLARVAVIGAVFGALGALVGTLARHQTLAVVATVVWELVETVISRAGTTGGVIAPYLPFQLAGPAAGLGGHVPGIAAVAILVGYLAALGLVVRLWGLARDA